MSNNHRGNIFHNRYHLIKLVSAGRMSTAWEARDMSGNTTVTLTILSYSGQLDSVARESFRNEFRVMYDLNHPNLFRPTHFDIDPPSLSPYLISTYYSNGSAKNIINKTERGIKERMIALFLRDAASALNVLHNLSEPIIHQDIKPDNFLINDDGKYILADFGVSIRKKTAGLMDDHERLKGAGARPYAAPEIFSGESAKPAQDIFSLGVSLFEILTGVLPFQHFGGVLLNQGQEVPELYPYFGYTSALNLICKQCMQPLPEGRPTARQLLQWANFYIDHRCWPAIPVIDENEIKVNALSDESLPIIQSNLIIEENNFIIEEENNLIIEEENNFIIEEENNLIIEEENNLIVEEENNLIVEEENNLIVEEENNLIVEEENNLIVEEENNLIVEEENNLIVEEENNRNEEEENSGSELKESKLIEEDDNRDEAEGDNTRKQEEDKSHSHEEENNRKAISLADQADAILHQVEIDVNNGVFNLSRIDNCINKYNDALRLDHISLIEEKLRSAYELRNVIVEEIEKKKVVRERRKKNMFTVLKASSVVVLSVIAIIAISSSNKNIFDRAIQNKTENPANSLEQGNDKGRFNNNETQQSRIDQAKIEQAKIEQAKIEQAKIEQAKTEQAKIEQAKIEQTKIEQTKIEQAKIEQAKAGESKMEATKSEQDKVDKAKVEKAKLEREKIEQAKVEQARIEEANIEQAKIDQAKRVQARIDQTRIEQAKIEQARVEQEKLEQSKLEQAKLEQAKLEQDKLEPPKLEQATAQPVKAQKKRRKLN